MIKVVVFVILMWSGIFGGMHKYYMSITEIEWNEKEQSAEIIMNVFIDDLEKALAENNKRKIIYGDTDFDQTVFKYISSCFAIRLSNKPAPIKLIGTKLTKDIISIYIEAEQVKTINNGTIKNSLLTEVIGEQTNMVTVIENKNKRTLLLSKSHPEEMIRF